LIAVSLLEFIERLDTDASELSLARAEVLTHILKMKSIDAEDLQVLIRAGLNMEIIGGDGTASNVDLANQYNCLLSHVDLNLSTSLTWLHKVRGSKQVQDAAIEAVQQIFSSEHLDTKPIEPELVFVYFESKHMTGFSGRKRVYLNLHAFQRGLEAKLASNVSEAKRSLAFKIETGLLVLHELPHVLLRQIKKNFNASTPDFIANVDQKDGGLRESGRRAECKFWMGPATMFWKFSKSKWIFFDEFNKDWMESWVDAVEKSSVFPQYEDSVGALPAPNCHETGLYIVNHHSVLF